MVGKLTIGLTERICGPSWKKCVVCHILVKAVSRPKQAQLGKELAGCTWHAKLRCASASQEWKKRCDDVCFYPDSCNVYSCSMFMERRVSQIILFIVFV
jgi:hypothetical protein